MHRRVSDLLHCRSTAQRQSSVDSSALLRMSFPPRAGRRSQSRLIGSEVSHRSDFHDWIYRLSSWARCGDRCTPNIPITTLITCMPRYEKWVFIYIYMSTFGLFTVLLWGDAAVCASVSLFLRYIFNPCVIYSIDLFAAFNILIVGLRHYVFLSTKAANSCVMTSFMFWLMRVWTSALISSIFF